jgi:hypothetical protein
MQRRRIGRVGRVVGLVLMVSPLAVGACSSSSDDGDTTTTVEATTTTRGGTNIGSGTGTSTTSSTTSTSTPTSETTETTGSTTPSTTRPLLPGDPCELGSNPDCIDPDGDGNGVYLINGGACIAALPVELCADLDGDGVAGYPDSG